MAEEMIEELKPLREAHLSLNGPVIKLRHP
jgi:hypothetical protein